MANASRKTLLYALLNTAKKDIKDAVAWAEIYEGGRSLNARTKKTPYMVASLVYLFQTSNCQSNLIGKALCETIDEYNAEEEIYLWSSFRFPVISIYNVIKEWKNTNDVPIVFNVQLICEEYDIMHAAAARDDLDIITWMFRYNVHVDTKDLLGKTALHIAAASGRMRTIRYLLSSGASLFSLDHRNRTPLEVALDNFNFHIAEILKPELLCNLRVVGGETILMRLVRDGLEPQVRYMLRFADFSIVNYLDQNILHVCVESGQALVMECILNDVNMSSEIINAYDAFNQTPLSLAVLHHRASIVESLLAAGAVITPDIANMPTTDDIAILLKQNMPQN